MRDVPWKLRFPQAYQKVRQIPLARNLPPAQWMFLSLENGFVNSTDYLPWAQNYYGLGILKELFFEPQHFSSIPYQKYKNMSTAWGPQALPVFEWENILFVACIDPHSVPDEILDLPGLICRPLLAHYEDLVKAWTLCLEASSPNQISPITISTVSQFTSPVTPPAPAIDPAQVLHITKELITPHNPTLLISQESSTESVVQEQSIVSSIAPNSEISSVEVSHDSISSVPINLNEKMELNSEPPMMAKTEPSLNRNSLDSESSTIEGQKFELKLTPPIPTEDLFELLNSTEGVSTPLSEKSTNTNDSDSNSSESNGAAFEMPEGLSFGLNSEPKKELISSENQNDTNGIITNQDFQIPHMPQAPTDKPTLTSLSMKPNNSSSNKDAELPVSAKTPIKNISLSTPPPLNNSPSPSSTTNRNNLISPVSAPSTIESKSVITPPPITAIQTEELEEELTLGFTKAYQFYRNLMILKLKENVAIPMRWDPSFKKAKSLSSIPLDKPSIFRIAFKTKKPFHGPITSNPINDQFIEHWFDGHKPNYLTIFPLFFEKECVGLLLGASDEPLDRKDSLHLMESTAEMIEINFGANLAA